MTNWSQTQVLKYRSCEISKCPKLTGLEEGEVPIFPVSTSFQHKFPGTWIATSIRRHQLPLVAAYNYTSYKAQGKTPGTIIADLQPTTSLPIDTRFAYVALSRVKSLEDLVLLRPFPISVLQATRPKDLIAQEKRLKNLELRSIQ